MKQRTDLKVVEIEPQAGRCESAIEEDRCLVRKCLKGEEAAYREFVERFQSVVFGVALRCLGNRVDAEDVAQESMVRAIRHLSSWDGRRPLRPWVLTIVSNRCRTLLSRNRKRPRVTELVVDPPARPVDDGAEKELLVEIKAALGRIKPKYRQIFLLFHEQGLSYEEMGQIEQKPVGTIKTWLHRARRELLALLQERGVVSGIEHDISRV